MQGFIEEVNRVEEFYLKNLDDLIQQFRNIEKQRDSKDDRME